MKSKRWGNPPGQDNNITDILMSTRRFFSHHPITANTLRITGDEYHHLKHVNRAKCGEPIEVINGQGTLFWGEIRAMKANEAIVQVKKEKKAQKPPVSVIAAPSLLKQRPMNLMVEKLTEMGVDEIRPIMFNRTDETYSPSRLKKWHRIAAQSLKVNKQLWLTDIYPPVPIDEIIEISQSINTKILLDILSPGPKDFGWQFPVIVVIGPPGDMVTEEREKLVQNGFIPYKINDCLLKSETAAISIAAILMDALRHS
ncbi:MAG: 16S rRNA (uracil(1498)-N(3))-methyltransferase [Candidatus Aminicenantes bacterium]|nr:MAG: 16S rRNA (uracil(1498)-N(3))-methyltransferase [Candidatus Aminicenantes bacterium]